MLTKIAIKNILSLLAKSRDQHDTIFLNLYILLKKKPNCISKVINRRGKFPCNLTNKYNHPFILKLLFDQKLKRMVLSIVIELRFLQRK